MWHLDPAMRALVELVLVKSNSKFLQNTIHNAGAFVSEIEMYQPSYCSFVNSGFGDDGQGGIRISADKAACAELGPPEVPRNNTGRILNLVPAKRVEYRSAGGSRWFAVIGRSIHDGAGPPSAICPTVVGCIMVTTAAQV